MVQQDHSLRLLAALLAASLILCGCPSAARRPNYSVESSPETQPPPVPSAAPAVPPPPPARSAPPSRENHLSPATRSLVTQAHTLSAHGDLDGASSTLDRALRIEPNNPLLWIERGRLRLSESDAKQAEGCARKALVLASGDRAAQGQAGHLLADALRAQQRNTEAAEVERRPYMH